MKGQMPKAEIAVKEAFKTLLPDDPRVTVRPMFGNVAAFVNGNMFSGVFGEDVFVRLPEGDRAKVQAGGGGAFEPMPGRAMKEYVVLPSAWRSGRDGEKWVRRSLEWAAELPPKT